MKILVTAVRVLTQSWHDRTSTLLVLTLPAALIALVAWVFSRTSLFDEFGPALLAFFPFSGMFLQASIMLVRERLNGTLARSLSMPLGRMQLLLGYGVGFGALGVVQVAILVPVTTLLCGLTVTGPILLLLVLPFVCGMLGAAVGLLASAFARTEVQVVQFFPAFVFPQVLIGGLFIPRSQLPPALEAVGDKLPLSFAFDALFSIVNDTQGAYWIWERALGIAAWLAAALVAGALTLRRRTE